MVRAARGAGASAKFAGSGGAIVGTCDSDAKFHALTEAMDRIRCRAIRLETQTDPEGTSRCAEQEEPLGKD